MKLPIMPIGRLIPVIALGLALGACESGSASVNALGGGSSDGGVAIVDEAQVRVLHLSPTAPAVDVYVDGASEPAVRALPFREGTEYLTLPAGTHRFDVVATGASAEEPLLTVGPLDLAAGVRATAVAFSNPSSIEGLVLIDDVAKLSASETRVRVVHVANGVGDVTVLASSGGAAEKISLADDLGYGEPAGAIDVSAVNGLVVEIDANADLVADFTFDVPALPAGILVNVFAVAENSQLSLVAQLPDGETVTLAPRGDASLGQSQVRVVHLSPDVGVVDLYVNGATEPAIEDLAYGESTTYVTLGADRYVFDIAPANTSIAESILRVGPNNVPGGVALTAVGFGTAPDIQLLVMADDPTGIAPNDVRVQVGHAATGVGTVDVRLGGGGECGLFVIGNDLAIGEASGPIDVTAGLAYVATIDVDLDGVGDLEFETPALPGGALIDVLAVTGSGGEVFLLAILPDGNTLRIDPSGSLE